MTSVQIMGLDHVQLSMPGSAEDQARAFYGGVLGMTEVANPAALVVRGGCWFVGRGIHLHLGVEPDMRPSPKAHIALLAGDLDTARAEFEAAGVTVTDDDSGVDFARFYVEDPFGNRIEIVAARDAGFTARQPVRGRA